MENSGFEIAAAIRSMTAGTWGKAKSLEHMESLRLIARDGPVSRVNALRLPDDALAARDMTAVGSSGSNYLIGAQTAGYLPALQPASVVLRLGAQQLNFGPGGIVLPKGTTSVTTQWLADENSVITESQPTIGQVASTPRILAALTEISHQMLKQSNAEELVRTELRRAAAAAIDKAALQGTGVSGQPIGIVNTSGIGAFTGTTLNRAQLSNAQLDVATANAVISGSVGYATTPAVADLLANRADTIESTRAVWQGALHAGTVLGARALSTTGMPAATMIYGDWANLSVATWGSIELAADPFTKFTSGLVAIRLLLLVDTVTTTATGFSVASSIT